MRRPSHRRHNPSWVGGPKAWRRSSVTAVSSTEILKELYPQHKLSGGPVMERSWAAKMARERHRITWEQYFAMPLQDTGRRVPRASALAYAESPFFRMLKKPTHFGASR